MPNQPVEGKKALPDLLVAFETTGRPSDGQQQPLHRIDAAKAETALRQRPSIS
jgi:hypothetical protein